MCFNSLISPNTTKPDQINAFYAMAGGITNKDDCDASIPSIRLAHVTIRTRELHQSFVSIVMAI